MTYKETHDEKLKKYRLNQKEYESIKTLLKREPKGVEWALFSALWSEHCSYKSSKVHLKGLYNSSPRVLQSFGENAGVVDLGGGERIAFKMESHNHPSFIEPYQGAATGVGGILRDVFTMGARPIALANYLCFGETNAERMSTLVDGVVRGIGGYGNSVGVPNITGQTEFHSSYNKNILVNAFALGLFRPGEKVFLSKAKGPGNLVVYVGAKTGRDGIHGASMASESFDKESEKKRPTIQIGDPFLEKCLIESCIEVMKQDLVVAIQDMGAAGLTSSSFEMAAKGNVGFDIDLKLVPLRDSTLTAEDILLSESQERMLLVCEPKQLQKLKKVFERWNLDATAIGKVVKERKVTLRWGKEVLTEIDPCLLTDEAPQHNRDFEPWKPLNRVECEGDIEIEPKNIKTALLEILKSPMGMSREWIYRQYDQRVGARTSSDCSSDIGVVQLPDSGRGLAIALGCRTHVMRWDAKQGGYDSVAFPALELACKGFESLGATDCLNYGNPEKKEIMSAFVASLRAMSEQCEQLEAPIISGNVSFYNETMGQNITSTPSVGLVGLGEASLLDRPSDQIIGSGQEIFVLSLPKVFLGGSYQELKTGKLTGFGEIDPKLVRKFVNVLVALTRVKNKNGHGTLVRSSKMVGKFGLAYTLARMCSDVSVKCATEEAKKTYSQPRDWFVERFYEVVLTVERDDVGEFKETLKKLTKSEGLQELLELINIGESVETEGEFVKDAFLSLDILGEKLTFQELKQAYNQAWEEHFAQLS